MSLKNIIAHLDKNGFLVVSKLPCVSHGENEAVGINVSTEDDFLSQMPTGTNWYFEFESADGQKQVCGPVTPQNGLLACNVTNSVLCCPGEAQVQIVATDQNSDYIFKSSVATFFVSQSINATDKNFVRDDLLAKIDKLMVEMQDASQNATQTGEQLQQLVDDVNQKLENGEFVGEKGEKGDKGDSPQVKLNGGHLYEYNSRLNANMLIGRVQGAGIFSTTTPSSLYYNVPRDTIYPLHVKPLDGDSLIFPDGGVHRINNVGLSNAVGCTSQIFSIKGIKGDKGDDGVSTTDVRQQTITDEDGQEVHLITFYFSDYTTRTIRVKNGQDGKDGQAGGANGLVIEVQNDDSVLHLTQDGQILGEGIVLPQGGGAGSTNYLVNSNFAINQRGQSVYDTQGQGRTYTVDRWAKNSDTGNVAVTPLQNGVRVHGLPSGGGELFVQPVEPSLVAGKKVTLSAKAKNLSGKCRLGIMTQGGSSTGTPVPNDGSVVQNLFFNTSLTIDETVEILSKIQFEVDEYGDNEPYVLVSDGDFDTFAKTIVIIGFNGMYVITDFSFLMGGAGNVYFISADEPDLGLSAGWQGVDCVDYGVATVSDANGMPAGNQNDILTEVVSASEGFGGGSGNANAFVTLKAGTNSVTADVPKGATSVVCGIFGNSSGAKGTPLPTDGTVLEKICFNTNATVDEVVAVMSQIVPQPNNINYLFVDTSDTIRLCLENQNGSFLIKDEKGGSIYFDSDSGWQDGAQNGITVGNGGLSFVVVDSLSVPVGLFNDEVTGFVSATKFFDGYGKVGVPANGSVPDVIYFDPSFSVQETVDVIEKANLPWQDMGDGENFAYFVAVGPDQNGEQPSVIITKNSKGYAILLWGYLDVFVSCDDFGNGMPSSGVAGWQQSRLSYWGLENAMPWQTSTTAVVGAGSHNDMLADIVYVMGKTDLSFVLEWAKLEVGKKATEYLAPQPALEMVACQRYYQKFSCNNLVGYAKDSSAINVALPLTNNIRQNPMLVGDNVAGFFGAVGNTTPSLVGIDDNVVQLSFATQNNATAGNVYVVQNYHGALDDEIY